MRINFREEFVDNEANVFQVIFDKRIEHRDSLVKKSHVITSVNKTAFSLSSLQDIYSRRRKCNVLFINFNKDTKYDRKQLI